MTILMPDWPAPENVHAAISSRKGGLSVSPWDELNLAFHVGDDAGIVEKNWQILSEQLRLSVPPQLLRQVHGTAIVLADTDGVIRTGDGCYANRAGPVCTVMTADCLPLLFCNMKGTEVAAIHAGWRGLASGIVDQAIRQFDSHASELLVYLGPAISQPNFEVGGDVLDAFLAKCAPKVRRQTRDCFVRTDELHWKADLYSLAKIALNSAGVTQIYGGDFCTYEDVEHFYSYRRDGQTGRMASLIWIS